MTVRNYLFFKVQSLQFKYCLHPAHERGVSDVFVNPRSDEKTMGLLFMCFKSVYKRNVRKADWPMHVQHSNR